MRVLFLNNERRNLLIALSKYRLCLENRCLLERNAEILYPTFRSGAAVQELIKDMVLDPPPPPPHSACALLLTPTPTPTLTPTPTP